MNTAKPEIIIVPEELRLELAEQEARRAVMRKLAGFINAKQDVPQDIKDAYWGIFNFIDAGFYSDVDV